MTDLLPLWYRDDFAGVVSACSKTPTTAEIASVCVLAACHLHAAAKARQWFATVANTQQDALAARCKDLSNLDLAH
jgi:hypothetical protein